MSSAKWRPFVSASMYQIRHKHGCSHPGMLNVCSRSTRAVNVINWVTSNLSRVPAWNVSLWLVWLSYIKSFSKFLWRLYTSLCGLLSIWWHISATWTNSWVVGNLRCHGVHVMLLYIEQHCHDALIVNQSAVKIVKIFLTHFSNILCGIDFAHSVGTHYHG